MKKSQIFGVTPFERPDVQLALAIEKAGAYPVLSLGRDKAIAAAALKEMAARCDRRWGVCLVEPLWEDLSLPDVVDLVVLPYGLSRGANSWLRRDEGARRGEGFGARADESGRGKGSEARDGIRTLYQVHSMEEALAASAAGARSLIIKGNEAAGRVGSDSSFIFFQRMRRQLPEISLFVQGGIGVHTMAALTALGAAGVVLDSQLVLFAACSASVETKKICEHLNGQETKVVEGRRILVRPNSPELPLGQDIALSADLVRRYKTLDRLVFGLHEAAHGYLRQAKAKPAIARDGAFAKAYNLEYPIAQGPMTRVSDVPDFGARVGEGGGLPFVALSLLKGDQARTLIRETGRLAGSRTWGVGILGFAPAELREEQLGYILEEKPPVVLIAGGRPSQAKPLEKAGIRTFLHVPSVALLDIFLKEGSRRMVFEGRECGGHVGPLYSLILWEKQIARLMQEESLEGMEILFAGGIHDDLSAAFVSVMAAPLATRGACIGVLMGTAYLYTEEAVASGAIVPTFQQQAVAHINTCLLETAPGHETRCLDTDFVALFGREKEMLQDSGLDKQEIWARLESLNVGRLRIAAKGLERRDDQLVSIDETEQLSSGMYMIGQVVALQDKITTIRRLHETVAVDSVRLLEAAELPSLPESSVKPLDIAVIGMACIYPGARNIEEYWRNIILGKDAITEVPDERWNKELYFDPHSNNGDKSPSKWGGFIPRIDFDPMEFGIPPQSLAAIEPSQLLSLLVARQALENAGYAGPEADKENVSVIIGAEGGNHLSSSYGFRCLYPQLFGAIPAELDQALPRLTEDSFPGVLANVIAGRITNRLDLGGRNYTVDAACASSLAAVDLACQELVLGKSDMVIAGAVDLHNDINDYLLFSSTHALSRNGRCMTFDSSADGIALGEGVAMLVLKRYEDAQRDGDNVYAVIKGVGGSSDGKSLGLTAPRRAGQEKALQRAYQQAGISPVKVGLFEAHGTGTVVGDKTELSALTDLMTACGAIAGQTHLGSVKTQIGHTKCAAGMAGLIKAVLSVYHGVKPPTLHLKTPNQYYNRETSPFAFHTQSGLWNETTRVAGVSAFGFGGTNFHAVLQSAGEAAGQHGLGRDGEQGGAVKGDAAAVENRPVLDAWPTELFVFRGDTYEEAMELLRTVRAILLNSDTTQCRDLAYSLVCHSDKPVQLSIVADCADDLLIKMDLALSGAGARGLYPLKPVEGKAAFLFSGQGSQQVNMGRELLVLFPFMRKLLREYPHYEKLLFPDAVFDEQAKKEQKENIRDTRVAQPLLGIIEHALAGLLRHWGIEPDMAAGHSYGELPALCFAGVFPDTALVALSEKRAASILDAIGEDKGMMVAVNAAGDVLETLLAGVEGVYAVNHNSSRQWVLAGTTKGVRTLIEQLKERKLSYRQLEVACAFHSPLLNGADLRFLSVLNELPMQAPRIPVWSNTSGGLYPTEADAIRGRLAEHLVKPVLFHQQIEQMAQEGAKIWIEVGPGKVLCGLVKDILGQEEGIWHTEDTQGLSHLLSVAASWLSTGRSMNLDRLFEGRNVRMLDLSSPDNYKKSATTWVINGHTAMPVYGSLPAHGAVPVVKPLVLAGAAVVPAGGVGQTVSNADRMVEEYLKTTQLMIQAQRDVLLQYLGQSPTAFERPAALPASSNTATPVSAVTVAAEPVEAVKSALPEPPVEKLDVKMILLKVVSDKTGYPIDMLGLDQDMEADLSIDSIKRMEIIATLKSKLGELGTGQENEADLTEQLSAIKTLQGIIDWVGIRVGMDGNAVEEARKIIEEGFSHNEQEETLTRMRFSLDPCPMLSMDGSSLRGARLAIAGGGAQGILLKTRLEEDGVVVDILEDGAGTVLAKGQRAMDEYDGLVLLNAVSSATEVEAELSALDAFSLIKSLDLGRVRWVYAVSGRRRSHGFSGLLKSLEKEFPSLCCRSIQLDAAFDPELIIGELLNTDRLPEIVYQDGIRHQVAAVASPLIAGGESDIRLTKDSVVLVLGGGQGITAELMLRLSQENPCRYVVVGRSPDPRETKIADYPAQLELVLAEDGVEDGAGSSGAVDGSGLGLTRDRIREALIAERRIKHPAEIERKVDEIYRHQQVMETLQALESNGAVADYYSLDVRDAEKLTSLIQELYRRYDRIDGVIHGAGVLEDKLLRQKSVESFNRVFSTKVEPLKTLETTIKDDVQFVALFSSVSSVFGNRGQTDYAAANSVLDRTAMEWNAAIDGKVLAINWGPWKGKGMVSVELEREYARRGIALIPLQTGADAFINELKYGRDAQVLIMAGQTF